MKITVKQLRTIIKEEVSKATVDKKIEDWVAQHEDELAEFFASNPRAVKAVTAAANQSVNEGDFVAGVKDYYKGKGDKAANLAASGVLAGGPLLAMLPDSLTDSLYNAIGHNASIAAATLAAMLAGHLADVAIHAKDYADKNS